MIECKFPTMQPARPPDAPADPYMATLWQRWRAQLRLTRQTPWLAARWLKQQRTLLDRASRIYADLCRQPRTTRRRLQRQLGISLTGVALALALGNTPVHANNFTANDAASLIAAINSANANPGPDTITLTGDVTLSAVDNSKLLLVPFGLPIINSPITLEGAGHTIARPSTAPEFVLLNVSASGNLTLNEVTLRGGYSRGSGGNIYNTGTLTVSKSTISGATADSGGGIFNTGALTVVNSTLNGNTAIANGGGIFNYTTATVINSTISGNTASGGGGIYNSSYGSLTLKRSLLAGNNAPLYGPEIYNLYGTINADQYNLIGYSGDVRSFAFTPGSTDIVPSVGLTAILNPSLANNGGPMLTHALVAGSPAIDAAGFSGQSTDQRGVGRGCISDIGAFEVEGVGGPDIDVQGNGITIACGDTTPRTNDGTDFSSTGVHNFTLRSTGPGTLTLLGAPRVVLSGPNANDFTVTMQPQQFIGSTGSNLFQIAFAPSSLGIRRATVTIANNDIDEGTYTFAIQGMGDIKVTSQLAQLSFSKVSSSTTPDNSYSSLSTAGVLLARLALKNSGSTLANLYFRVNVLNNNNWLLNADGAPGQVGSRLSVANSALPGGNNLWETNEAFNQDFRIGVMLAGTVQFKVDVYTTNVTAADATGSGDELLGTYYVEFDPTAPDNAHVVYLPAVSK